MSRFAKALWFSILAPILVAFISVIAIASWDHLHPKTIATEVRFFEPSPPYGVAVTQVTGSCFVEFSIADYGAPDAHRCFSKNDVYDPCFSQTASGVSPTSLACALSPWTHQLVLVRVTRWMADSLAKKFKVLTFPANSAAIYKYARNGSLHVRDNLPWALDLGGGLHCIAATGTAGSVRGLRENYLCVHGDFLDAGWWHNAGYVLGTPNRRGALWQVIYLPPGAQTSRQVSVKTAWY